METKIQLSPEPIEMTEEEQLRALLALGMSESEARALLAIERGEMQSDVVTSDELPNEAAQTEFRLSSEQWEAFCQRLDASPKTIPALRQLFSEPEPFKD